MSEQQSAPTGKRKGSGGTIVIILLAAVILFGSAWWITHKTDGRLPGEDNPRREWLNYCASKHGQIIQTPEGVEACAGEGDLIWSYWGAHPVCWYPPDWIGTAKFDEKVWNDSCHAAHPEATLYHDGHPIKQ